VIDVGELRREWIARCIEAERRWHDAPDRPPGPHRRVAAGSCRACGN
jgi:hypothetical protein